MVSSVCIVFSRLQYLTFNIIHTFQNSSTFIIWASAFRFLLILKCFECSFNHFGLFLLTYLPSYLGCFVSSCTRTTISSYSFSWKWWSTMLWWYNFLRLSWLRCNHVCNLFRICLLFIYHFFIHWFLNWLGCAVVSKAWRFNGHAFNFFVVEMHIIGIRNITIP